METLNSYPVNLTIEYPAERDRLITFFRIFAVIPILIIYGLVGEKIPLFGADHGAGDSSGAIGMGIVFLPTVLMILFRKKYPVWWFDWNVALTKFGLRVFSFLLLLRDEYPSTDEEQAITVEIAYPDVANELNRALPLIKWFLAIPHFIVLVFLFLAAVICVIISWFSILLFGDQPRTLFHFVEGVLRWSLRVSAYALLLTTDQYPPFSLSA